MRARLFILLLNLSLSGSLLFGQVSVQILDPVLEPGESTMVVVEVSDASSDCSIHIYGINNEALVNFRDTVVHIPGGWPNELPFVVMLPVQALPNVAAVWGQYLIVAELSGTAVAPEIIALSPGQPCSGSVGVGPASAMMTFEWEATGQFTQFEVVLCENPCGKEPWPTPTPGTPTPSPTPTPTPTTPTPTPTPTPPSPPPTPTPTPTPTTPTPTPTPSPQPSGPITPGPVTPSPEPSQPIPSDPVPVDTDPGGWDDDTDTPLPPLPPGWAWGPEGPYWTGEHPPEPPALPPGWEWGPLYPYWVGIGEPTRQVITHVSGIIPASQIQTGAPVNYSHTINISSFVEPGAAYVYQVYGILQDSDGSQTGVLSQAMCERYSPVDADGEPAENTPCPKAGCTLSYGWVKKTPIRVIRPLDNYPKGDDLKEMIPGTCISFSALANDFDLLRQECQGMEDCEEEEHAVKRIGPIEHGVQYKWTLNGEGGLKEVCQNTIFYQTPKKFRKGEKKVANIDLDLSNVGGKIADDPIQGKIKITMTFIDSCKCIDTEIEIQQPKEKKYDEDFKEKESKLCIPKDPEWKKASDITGTLTVQQELCPESLTILKAEYSDNDQLKLVCEALSCGKDEETLNLNDPLTYTWNDGGAGGRFPLGSTGACVLYKAPNDLKNVTFSAHVRDSRTQFPDKDKNDTGQSEVKQLLDLTEINVNTKGEYSNITVGHPHKFKPVWEPSNGKVKKIVWELDLGGDNGKVRKVLCDPDGLTQDKASLKFTTKDKEEGLEVSWKAHSHIHGIKDLKCTIWGEAETCQDCCICVDDEWDESDFLGRDPLEITQFRLFFEKEEFKDDGRVENLTTVRDYDEYREKTRIHGEDAMNWFTHWSQTTYATCQHDHKLTDPKVRYQNSSSWLGLYEKDTEMISLAKKAAQTSTRDEWKGAGFIEGSDMKWIDTRLKTQRAYDLKGHNLANKVYLHEYGHFTSMTKNWRPGGAWHKAYGAQSKVDVSKGKWSASTSKNKEVTVQKVGNYGQKKADGIDVLQKYNITITLYTGNKKNKKVRKTVSLTNAWFVPSPAIKWTDENKTKGTVSGSFEVKTVAKKYEMKGLQLEEFDRANDPDQDYIPNQEEDKVGTSWQHDLTHKNHARGKEHASNGLKQLPDQEFWADQYMFDRYKQVEPGQPDKDWANPGAQSDPKYEK